MRTSFKLSLALVLIAVAGAEVFARSQPSIAADGLKLDMSFVLTTLLQIDCQTFSIKSLTEHTATVSVSRNVKVGDQLTTRIPDVSYAE